MRSQSRVVTHPAAADHNPASPGRVSATAMSVPARKSRRHVTVVIASAALLVIQFAPASEEADRVTAAHGMVVADGRELIVLHPRRSEANPGRPLTAARELPGFAAQSHEVDRQRVHVVELDGETYRAATPIDGPRSRIVFDPARRKFASLLPSIRVELDGDVNTDAVSAELDATRVTVFESLGFAILELPDDVHPVDAVRRVRNLSGGPTATVRLRSHRLEWK